MKLLQNKLVIIVGSFLLGGLSTYFISDYIRMKNQFNTSEDTTTQKKNEPTKSLSFKGDKNNNNPFAQMDKITRELQHLSTSLRMVEVKATFQKINKEGILAIGPSIEIMAEAEELFAHKNAVTLRLNDIKNV